MGYVVLTPSKSFVRFDSQGFEDHCLWGEQPFCLPVLEESDVAFQWVVEADTEAEADALCTLSGALVVMGLVRECGQAAMDVTFTDLPERYRLSATQVLYNWSHGLVGMAGEYAFNECFYIRLEVDGTAVCSNCFQRIGNGCFTSVLEFGNDENFAGYNYCNSGAVPSEDGGGSCDPTFITFLNKTTLDIPYTAGLAAMYGSLPSISSWLYNSDGDLQNMGIVATFDAYPVTLISLDMGGSASGVVRIS